VTKVATSRITNLPVYHDPGKVGHLGNPATVVFTLDLDLHCVVPLTQDIPTPANKKVITSQTFEVSGREASNASPRSAALRGWAAPHSRPVTDGLT
jgi:hypothetical protein